MAWTMRCFAVVSLAVAGGCTGENPWFLVGVDTEGSDATDSAGTLGATTTTATPTTAATEDATSERTTSAGTSDAPTTSGATSEHGTSGAGTSGADSSDSGSQPMTTSGETGGPFCGDGSVDEDLDEQCDQGQDNGSGGECTEDCQITVCGDGYAGGEEECDLGVANDDGGLCTLACKLPVCGDGKQNGAEICDSGLDNGNVPGKCSADCLAMIPAEPLKIKLSVATNSGKFFAENMMGIPAGDVLCGPGFAVMAVAPDVRTASTGDFDGQGQQAWVLKKYRAYVNGQGQLLGITGAEGLLGVVNGKPVDLKAAIGFGKAWTGLTPTWRTAEDNCGGWKTVQDGAKGVVGDASSTSSSFIAAGEQDCDVSARLYCVQQ